MSTCNRLQPCKFEVWERVLKCRSFDPFSKFSGLVRFVPEFSVNLHIYTADQGGLVLWYPLSPVAALLFVAIIPSSYLACVFVCISPHHTWQALSPTLPLIIPGRRLPFPSIHLAGIVVCPSPQYTWQALSPVFLMTASPLCSEDIWRGKQHLMQKLLTSNIVKHLV